MEKYKKYVVAFRPYIFHYRPQAVLSQINYEFNAKDEVQATFLSKEFAKIIKQNKGYFYVYIDYIKEKERKINTYSNTENTNLDSKNIEELIKKAEFKKI